MRTMQLAGEEHRELSAEFARYLEVWYPTYLDGHLLDDGGAGAQPARYWAIIGALKESDAAIEKRYHELKPQQNPEG